MTPPSPRSFPAQDVTPLSPRSFPAQDVTPLSPAAPPQGPPPSPAGQRWHHRGRCRIPARHMYAEGPLPRPGCMQRGLCRDRGVCRGASAYTAKGQDRGGAASGGALAGGNGRANGRKWRRAGQHRTDVGLSRPCLIGAARAPTPGEAATASPGGVTSPGGSERWGGWRSLPPESGGRSLYQAARPGACIRSGGEERRQGPPVRTLRNTHPYAAGRPLKVVTKALAAGSFREFAEQPFVDPLLRSGLRPYFGQPVLRRCVPGPGIHEASEATGVAGNPAGHDRHSLP